MCLYFLIFGSWQLSSYLLGVSLYSSDLIPGIKGGFLLVIEGELVWSLEDGYEVRSKTIRFIIYLEHSICVRGFVGLGLG